MHLSPLLLSIGDRIADPAHQALVTVVDVGPGPSQDTVRVMVRDLLGGTAVIDVAPTGSLLLHEPAIAIAAYAARTSRRSLGAQLATDLLAAASAVAGPAVAIG